MTNPKIKITAAGPCVVKACDSLVYSSTHTASLLAQGTNYHDFKHFWCLQKSRLQFWIDEFFLSTTSATHNFQPVETESPQNKVWPHILCLLCTQIEQYVIKSVQGRASEHTEAVSTCFLKGTRGKGEGARCDQSLIRINLTPPYSPVKKSPPPVDPEYRRPPPFPPPPRTHLTQPRQSERNE